MDLNYGSVGFIGLGIMGFPMAECLATKLPSQRLSSRHPNKTYICESSKEVAERSDVILSIVPEGTHVRAVYLEPETGVLSADLGEKTLIDCSTIDIQTSLKVAEAIKARHPRAAFYDAPISGGQSGAERGTLTFMLGCDESDPRLSAVKHLLAMMGSNVISCGRTSLGLVAKLCNNYCSALIALATAESMNIGIKSGLSPRVLANIFSTSTAQNTICDKWCPVPGIVPDAPSSRGYKGGFRVQLMRKDFALAVNTAELVGAKLALGQAGLDTYTAAMNDPQCRDLDSRIVFRYLGGDEDWEKKFDK